MKRPHAYVETPPSPHKRTRPITDYQNVVYGHVCVATRLICYVVRYDMIEGLNPRYRILSPDWSMVSEEVGHNHRIVKERRDLMGDVTDDNEYYWNVTMWDMLPDIVHNAYKILDPRLVRGILRHYLVCKSREQGPPRFARWMTVGLPAALVTELAYAPPSYTLMWLYKTDGPTTSSGVLHRALMLCMKQPWFDQSVKAHGWMMLANPNRVTRFLAWKGVYGDRLRVDQGPFDALVPDDGEPKALYQIVMAHTRGPEHNVFGLLSPDVLRDHLFPWIKWSVPYPIPFVKAE